MNGIRRGGCLSASVVAAAVVVAILPMTAPAPVAAAGPPGQLAAATAWVAGSPVGTTGRANPGSLARTSDRGRSTLHVVTTQATGDSPGAVRYSRSTDAGATWEPPVRLGRRGASVFRAAVAGSGSDVHVAYVAELSSGGTRLYVRSSRAAGRPGSWAAAVRVSSAAGLEYASVAASGRRVLVTVSDLRRGALRLFRSGDHGRTWSQRVLDRSTRLAGRWRLVPSRVSISGSTAVVSWDGFSTGTSHVYARVSVDAGRTWTAARRLGAGATTSNAALRGRAVVALRVSAGRTSLRAWRGGTWLPLRRLPLGPDGLATGFPYVALHGRHSVGLAASSGAAEAQQVLWFRSADDARTWQAAEQVSAAVPPAGATAHAALWGDSHAPVVLWDTGGWHAEYALRTSRRA